MTRPGDPSLTPRGSWHPTRRDVLRAGALVTGGGLLAACSSGPTSATTPAASATTDPLATSAASTAGGPFVLDTATMSRLDALFDAQLKASGIAGMAAAVWLGDTAWRRTGGYADLAKETPYAATDFVRIASITKSFTATATLQLVDAGRLLLDDPVERFVPGLPNGTTITIKNLLGMTSGLFDFTADDGFTAKFDQDPTMPWTFADTVAIVKAHPPSFAPGTQLQYCDANYAILGEVIATVTGQPAGTVITQQVIERLGLKSTSYPTTSAVPDPHPTAYVPDVKDPQAAFDNAGHPPKVVNDVNPAVASTAGAMISTLDDLRVWGKEIAVGSLLKPATQALRLQARRFPNTPVNIGYGLGCEKLNDFTGHNGAIFGYSSVVFHNPTLDLTIAAVGNESTNFTTPTATFAYQFVKAFVPSQWV